MWCERRIKMRLRIIQLINNYYTDETKPVDPNTPLGEFCAFGYFDALSISEPHSPFGENDKDSIWKHSARETVKNIDGKCSRRNMLALILDDEKDTDFWRYVSEHECESPFLFLSMVRIIHSEHTRTCNLSEEIDKVNSRKDMIAYFSYDYSDMVILHLHKAYQSGVKTVLEMQTNLGASFYTILAINEKLLQLKLDAFKEKVDWKFYVNVKNAAEIHSFINSIKNELGGDVSTSDLLGEWDLVIEKKSVEFSTIFKLYKMGELLTHSNPKFMEAFYNARTEFQSTS